MLYDAEEVFETSFSSEGINSTDVLKTFDESLTLFLSELSKSILKDRSCKAFPDLITFAYFCRKSNISSFKNSKLNLNTLEKQFGWGTCIHIAPSNIPMNFAFSFIMGFMAGNKNIVRLPSKRFEQIDLFLKHYRALVQQEEYAFINRTNHFIRCYRGSKKLASLVEDADALVVWGGDSTVRTFKSFKKKASCIEVYFPNRKSSLLINSSALLAASEDEMLLHCQNFFNDTYLVDQNACSSPSMIIWSGEEDINIAARKRFSKSILHYIESKYSLDTILKIEKILDIIRFCSLTNGSVKLEQVDEKLWFLDIDNFKELDPKLGTFISKSVRDLSEVSYLLRQNEQTITYLGFSEKELQSNLLGSTAVMVDRVVPIGKALDMGFIWDGKNMINTLSRQVELY